MVKSFDDLGIFGSEPIEYTYRREDNYITRYCALMGMNDPLCYFLGNYDRKDYISNRWTNLAIEGVRIVDSNQEMEVGPVTILDSSDNFKYIKAYLSPGAILTVGANGTVLRGALLKNHLKSDYLFDIDIIYELVLENHRFFAKVNTGIIHLFGSDFKMFYRKQKRRIRDFLFFSTSSTRSYPWKQKGIRGIIFFISSCLLVCPLFLRVNPNLSKELPFEMIRFFD